MKKTKIISIVLLSLLVVGLVSAGIVQFFGQQTTTLYVESPIEVTGNEPVELTGVLGGATVPGEQIGVENKADYDVEIEITSDCKEGEDDCEDGAVETSYIGTLGLTQKEVDTAVKAVGDLMIELKPTIEEVWPELIGPAPEA